MLSLTFYNFSKPRNSFAVPDENNDFMWGNVQVNLKEPCTISNPTIKLTRMLDGKPIDNLGKMYNYAYIDQFQRYYFIETWRFIGGSLWEAELSVDPLASFRSNILNTTQYLLRSHDGSDATQYLTDTTYPVLNRTSVELSEYDFFKSPGTWSKDISKGCYVLSIISGADEKSFGTTSLYCLTHSEMIEFCNYLYGNPEWLSVDTEEISESLCKMLFNPIQYITSAIFYPFDAGWFVGEKKSEIKLGWWTIAKSAKLISERVLQTGSVELRIPKHPEADVRPSMNYEPFSTYEFYFPFIGSAYLDSKLLSDLKSLWFCWDIDIGSGEARVYVHTFDGVNIAIMTGNVGINVQLSEIRLNKDLYAYGSSLARAGTTALFKYFPSLDPGGKIAGSATGIASAFEADNVSTASVGSTGSFLGLVLNPHIKAVFKMAVEEDVERFGRPCCAEFKLNTLSGFVQTLDAKFSNLRGALPGEVDSIVNILNGGAFIE